MSTHIYNHTVFLQLAQNKATSSIEGTSHTSVGVDFKLLLQFECPDGNITSAACEKIMKIKEKEKALSTVLDLSNIKERPDDHRLYLIINRKPISSSTYSGLIDKLYDKFFGVATYTLEAYFEVWMDWRKNESPASAKTRKENRFLWNSLLKDTALTQIPIQQLTVQNFISFFRSITKDRNLTRKRFNDMKSILNGMLYLAVEQNIISHNCLNDIDYRTFAYKEESSDIFPYTENERKQIIEHLDDDLYSLAIKLDFYLVIRIGELRALKFSDVHDGFIRVERFMNDKNEIIKDTKGHKKEGKRYLPLVPAACELIETIRKTNPDSEYLFVKDSHPIVTVTFNRRLKKCCKELGIEYRSSHKIRFSTSSIMYKNGMSETELSGLLGHTTLNMTRHYLRNLTPADETAAKMTSILT